MDIFVIVLLPLYTLLIIQLDKIYPKKFTNFLIYYAWALSFSNFLIVFKYLILLVRFNENECFNVNSLYEDDKPLVIPTIEFFNVNNIGSWIDCEWLCVEWEFSANIYEMIMLSIVTFISSMVQLYSINYMVFDDYKKFTTYISFFTFFMIVLVSASNFLILFLGWEGVGLCSYLLINFWYTRVNANLAAMKALIVNRVADMFLTMGIILIFLTFLTLDFDVVFPLVPFFIDETLCIFNYDINIITLVGLLIFIGAMGKSAQLGLHTWLPDAMEGPTPVSALIHAATMVTAGVFLLIKCSPIFEYIPNILNFVVFIGAFTAFFSALIGLVQNDIKKIIAYSTCSQLGYMVFCCGLSAYDVSFFHLINHAFFKALLFLGAGAIIHSLSNEQDLRKYGLIVKYNAPFIYIIFIIGSLALVGFPFLTGFYSKDLILEIAFVKYTIAGSFSYFIGISTAFLTAVYSLRILYLTFLFEKNLFRRFLNFDTSVFFSVPLTFLTIGSLFFGYVSKDLFVGLGSDALFKSIFILPENNFVYDAEFFGWRENDSNWWIKLIPFIIINCALFVVIYINENNFFFFQKKNYFHILFSKKFFFDIFYNKFIVNGIIFFIAYDYIYKYFDKIILEIFGPLGVSYVMYNSSYLLRKMHYGIIFIYTIYFLLLISICMFIPFLYNQFFGLLY